MSVDSHFAIMKPAGSSVTGRGGADQTGGIANAPGTDAAAGSNLGSGTSKAIGSTTQYQGAGH